MIVTNAAQPVEAARKATSTVPIVMASVGDALGAGYIASLAHPGGNITGLTLVATEQSTKRLELIKEISQGMVRVAVLWNGNASGHRLQMKEMEPAALKLGIKLQSIPIQAAEEIDAALRAATRSNAQAIVTMDDPIIQSRRARIVEFATRQRMLVMGEFRSMADAGALMSYGPNQVDMWRRAAAYVDKIFKGAKPANLPVEQPIKFELVINLKTAKSLGLDNAAAAARPRRRGDRVTALFAAVRWSLMALSDHSASNLNRSLLDQERTLPRFGDRRLGRKRPLSDIPPDQCSSHIEWYFCLAARSRNVIL